ncbi:hypothetical protein DZF79_13930 [Vibrio parahaemolyticus]|nr:hypothetical protein [Vibrio parahaemolyticus]
MPNYVTVQMSVIADTLERKNSVMLDILDDTGTFSLTKFIDVPEITSKPEPSRVLQPMEEAMRLIWSVTRWGTLDDIYCFELDYKFLEVSRWHFSRSKNTPTDHVPLRCYPHRINKKRFKKSLSVNGVPNRIRFLSSWKPPIKAMKEISKRFPDVNLMMEFADKDDLGFNCGTMIFKNGKIIDSDVSPENQSDSEGVLWRKYAANLVYMGLSRQEIGLNEKWDYPEEEDCENA